MSGGGGGDVILQWLKTGVCEWGGRDVILQWLKTGVCEWGGGGGMWYCSG